MATLPAAVLFACAENAIRSPMAEALLHNRLGRRVYVASAGVRGGAFDPFAAVVMAEIGLDLSAHTPKSFDELADTTFDLVISLAPEAHDWAQERARTMAIDAEYWPMADPSLASGSRDQILDAYRALRDGLARRIERRFAPAAAPVR